MKYKLSYLGIALGDVEIIETYLEQFYPSTARKLFDKMEKQIASLEERPFLWPEYDRKPEYRRMVVQDYLVFYNVDKKTKIVEIRRILHGSQDIEKQLK